MYSAENEIIFGYKPDPKMKFKYNMRENVYFGRFCKTGLAKIMKDKNEMKCVELSEVVSNKENAVSTSNCNRKAMEELGAAYEESKDD